MATARAEGDRLQSMPKKPELQLHVALQKESVAAQKFVAKLFAS